MALLQDSSRQTTLDTGLSPSKIEVAKANWLIAKNGAGAL